jgi:hypothetical protein
MTRRNVTPSAVSDFSRTNINIMLRFTPEYWEKCEYGRCVDAKKECYPKCSK